MRLYAKDLNVEWGYCECGCKCNTFKCGPVYVEYFNDLKGSLRIVSERGVSVEPQSFSTQKELSKALMAATLAVVKGMIK